MKLKLIEKLIRDTDINLDEYPIIKDRVPSSLKIAHPPDYICLMNRQYTRGVRNKYKVIKL